MNVSFRPLRAEDLDRLFSERTRHYGLEWLERQSRGEVHVAVVELDGDVIGRAGLDFTQRPPAALLWSAHVEPPHQSRGIGTALFLHLEDVARERGVAEIQLGVGKENPRARRLYERLGYERCGEETDRWSYRDGDRLVEVAEECWTMRKRLEPG